LPRTGLAGLVIGGLAILACELPVLLVLRGVGGAAAAGLPPMVETVGSVTAAVGLMLMGVHYVRRHTTKDRSRS